LTATGQAAFVEAADWAGGWPAWLASWSLPPAVNSAAAGPRARAGIMGAGWVSNGGVQYRQRRHWTPV
jgi:hypothetical protein